MPGKGKIIKIVLLCSFFSLILGFIAVLALKSNMEQCRCAHIFSAEYLAMELSGRENLRWAQLKISNLKFETDDEINREIVYGKTIGGWNVDISDHEFPATYGASRKNTKCNWMKGSPTPNGGVVICNSADVYTLIRIGATINSPAYWEEND